MFADLLSTAISVVAALIIVVFVVYSLTPGTKFLKKHGRSYLKSDKPHDE